MARPEGEQILPIEPNYELTPRQKAIIGKSWELNTQERCRLYGPQGEETPGRVGVERKGDSFSITILPEGISVNKPVEVWSSDDPIETRRPLDELGVRHLPVTDLVEYLAAESTPERPTARTPRRHFQSLPPDKKALRAQQLEAKSGLAKAAYPGSVGALLVGMVVQTAYELAAGAWENAKKGIRNAIK